MSGYLRGRVAVVGTYVEGESADFAQKLCPVGGEFAVEDGGGPLPAFGDPEDVVAVAVAGFDACGPVDGGLLEAGDGAYCGVGEPADGPPKGISLGPAAVGICDDEDLAPGRGQRGV
jgi:hypothetical protein